MSTWVNVRTLPPSGTPFHITVPIKVEEREYDDGNIGDGNLTKITEFPGGTGAPRVSESFYDWRNRRVASKGGVQANENLSLTTQRPIMYLEYNNLNQVEIEELYDGDNVNIAFTNGVPDRPSSVFRQSKAEMKYDDRGRVYQTWVYSVVGGTPSAAALITNNFYDRRGMLVKSAAPGGLVSKMVYDGAGRLVRKYATDGAGDSGLADADDVVGDNVFEQIETQYDKNSNVEFTINRLRFHNAANNPDGNLSVANARNSFVAYYYDAANRLTTMVEVGTAGDSDYSRPSTPDSASDVVLVTSYTYDAAGRVDEVTDPGGQKTKNFYDKLSRTTKTIEAFVNGVPDPASDRITDYTYDASNRVVTRTADVPGAPEFQTTQYVYGVRLSDGSTINSNELLAAVRYPHKTTGQPDASEQERFAYNTKGQVIRKQDRNGSVHTYSYDVLGRPTADTVTVLGAGVDTTVRRLEISYDSAGRAAKQTSFSAPTGGSTVNQLTQEYNGLGQLVKESQSHIGDVTGGTPSVLYSYSVLGPANHSRLTGMTYPNGKVLTYNYTTTLDNSISRLTSISEGALVREEFSYLGLDTVVARKHPENLVDLTYIKQGVEPNGEAGDQYAGLDRFGRIVDQRWRKSDGSHPDRFKSGFDRDHNRMYRENTEKTDFSELYHLGAAQSGKYDDLNRLTADKRGTLNGSKNDLTGPASRSQSWTFDAMGNWSTLTTDGTPQTRTHNKQNQVTMVGVTPLTYDANGNLKVDEAGRTYIYDAWDRLISRTAGVNTMVYRYDALNRRISENDGVPRDLYYSNNWQVLEERVNNSPSATVQYVWSPVYMDALVLRDRDTDGDTSLDERLYVQQDANFNVTAVTNISGAVVERYVYDAYGRATFLNPGYGTPGSNAVEWNYLHQGGRYDAMSGLYHFRRRDHSSSLGRWLQQDPIGYVDGLNLYQYEKSNPVNFVDGFGLKCLEGSRTPIAKDIKGAKQLGWLFVGYQLKIEGGLFTTVCDKCCPDGRQIEDTEVKLEATAAAEIFGGLGVAIQEKEFGFEIFGYAGAKLTGSAAGKIAGAAKTDVCAGKKDFEISACAKFEVQGKLSGGVNVGIGYGWFNYEVGAEIFGTATTSTEACVKYSNTKGFSATATGFSDVEYRWGFKFCWGGCYTIYMN